jgi:hypothetical protein
VGVSREAQLLIEAMSRFHPVSGETTLPHQDADWPGATLVTSHDSAHRFKAPPMVSML